MKNNKPDETKITKVPEQYIESYNTLRKMCSIIVDASKNMKETFTDPKYIDYLKKIIDSSSSLYPMLTNVVPVLTNDDNNYSTPMGCSEFWTSVYELGYRISSDKINIITNPKKYIRVFYKYICVIYTVGDTVMNAYNK